MKISVDQVYTSVACNRIPEIVDWNKDGLICFGASNAVVIYDTKIKDKDPLTVLSHHRGKVNSVKWITKRDGSSPKLLSCSADKTAAIWSCEDGKWVVSSTLTGHGDGVTCIHGVHNGDDLIVYTGCIDSNIRVWECSNGITSLKQTINLQTGLCFTLHSHIIPTVNKPVLFCALDDNKIHVFAGNEEYHRVHTLVGHEDWVRGMDVLDVDDTTILLVSASQDTYIRLWRIQKHIDHQPSNGIRVEEKVFPAYEQMWSVKLDAVLAGHEGWVYGVQWYPRCFDGGSDPIYRLLSSSLDKTLIIWEPETQGGAWVERVRVGEVGGNGLGFYGSRFGPSGKFMGHGYNGSFHIWTLDKESNQWQPSVTCGGHFGPVEDVRWEPRGRYIASASLDQTTRIHAPWRRDDGEQWHELARPQVHGYDMASLALATPTTLVSAAEEKVIRVFHAPHNFLSNFANITREVIAGDGVDGAEGASVPSLGLSNKAVYSGQDVTDTDNDGYFVPVELHEPPTEETLQQNTLWPEACKLYGHGYEVYALDASADGRLVASACRAADAQHAAVLLWDTTTWQQIQKLTSHRLTVTQLAFSPDSQRLVSVSRDRRWTLYQKEQGSDSFTVAASTSSANGVHKRVIWCCAWSHDGAVFATGSRDGRVCVWSKGELTDDSLKGYSLVGKALEIENASVTALAFAPRALEARLVAVGLESGHVRMYGFEEQWTMLYQLDNSSAHHLTVKRLCFKPSQEDESDMLLASCGSDHFVRIHRICISGV